MAKPPRRQADAVEGPRHGGAPARAMNIYNALVGRVTMFGVRHTLDATMRRPGWSGNTRAGPAALAAIPKCDDNPVLGCLISRRRRCALTGFSMACAGTGPYWCIQRTALKTVAKDANLPHPEAEPRRSSVWASRSVPQWRVSWSRRRPR